MPTGDVHDQRNQPDDGKYWGYLSVINDDNRMLKTSQGRQMLYTGYISKTNNVPFEPVIAKLHDPAGYIDFGIIEMGFVNGENGGNSSSTLLNSNPDPNEYRRPKNGIIDNVFEDGEWNWGYIKTDPSDRFPSHCGDLSYEIVVFVCKKSSFVLTPNDRIKYIEYQAETIFNHEGQEIVENVMIALIKNKLI